MDSGSFHLAWPVLGALASLALFALTCRLALHPLRSYPGPFIAKITDGYIGYHALRRRVHLATWSDHQKYGSVYRQAPNRLVFNTATAVQDIYFNPGINKADHYKFANPPPSRFISLLGTLDKDEHRVKKKAYSQVLSDRAVRNFEPAMLGQIDVFLQELSKSKTEPVNLFQLAEHLTLDFATLLVWGESVETQKKPEIQPMTRAMTGFHHVVNFYFAWPLFSFTFPYLVSLSSSKRAGEIIDVPLRRVAASRIKLPKTARDDLYSVLGYDEPPEIEKIQESSFWPEGYFLLSAATVTTAAAISATFFYLSRSPEAYDRLASEIRDAFKSGRDICNPKLSSCKYLRAVIDESLRLSPPFPGTFFRQPYESHTEPFIVDGHVIPPGTAVGVNPYCIMHNAEYFPQPFQFQPDRWLEPEHEAVGSSGAVEARANMRKVFVPFAVGDRSCIGRSMAYNEMTLVVAKTLWYFDFEKAQGEFGSLGEGKPGSKDGRHRKEEFQLFDIAGADCDGPGLVFKPREEYRKDMDTDN